MPQQAQSWWARAATLTERLDALAAVRAGGVESLVTDEHRAIAAHVERRWRAVVVGRDAQCDPERFERRLEHIGLTVADLPELVAVDVPRPMWLGTVEAVGARGAEVAHALGLDDDLAWAADATVPFATLWRPWVDHAVAAVADLTPVAAGVARAVTDPLRAELVDVGASAALAALDTDLGRDRRRAGHAPYRRWVAAQLADRGDRLYDEFPVLARVLAVTTEQWVDAVVEMLGRLDTDRAELARRFGFGRAPIAAMRAAGDAHHGGRRVMVLTDTDQRQLVYKPRSLGPEMAVRRVADELSAAGAIDVEVVPDCLARDGYGWMQHVSGRPAADERERRLLGWRAGAVTMLARTLGVTDLHDENVIVDGAVPWLVDLECIAHPTFDDVDPDEVSIHSDSILSTCLLPQAALGDRGLDVAGFTATPGDRHYRRIGRWTGSGLGSMDRISTVQTGVRAEVDVPFDVGEFERGMVEFAAAACTALPVASVVSSVAGVERRLIPHATWFYATALERAVQGPALVHGMVQSVELDAVAGECHGRDTDGRALSAPWRRSLCEPVRRALERLEVPRFVGRTEGTAARLDDVVVEQVVVESGTELVARRLGSLDPRSVATQRAVLRLALEQRFGMRAVGPVATTSAGAAAAPPPLFDVCRSLGAELAATVTVDRLGRVQWVHAALTGDRPSAEFCGFGLFDGTAGVAVFLAALAAAGDGTVEPLARRALATAVAVRPEPGLAGGTAGVAWACAVVGALLDDSTLVAEADRLIREATWHEHDPTDLLAGRAGVLLAASAIAATSGDAATADLAAAHRRTLEVEWRATDRRAPLGRTTARRIGVAHGITGVSLAVARSLALDGDVGGLAWLDELIELENDRIAARDGVPARIVDAEGARRPDLGWCWGAAGVAVARDAIAEVRPTDAVLEPVARARELAASEVLPTARACCGVTGQLRAAHDLGTAAERLVDVLRRPQLRFERASAHRSPGLWRGISGVGLELLRRCAVVDVPDPLTLAPLSRTAGPSCPVDPSHHPSVRRPHAASVPEGALT